MYCNYTEGMGIYIGVPLGVVCLVVIVVIVLVLVWRRRYYFNILKSYINIHFKKEWVPIDLYRYEAHSYFHVNKLRYFLFQKKFKPP